MTDYNEIPKGSLPPSQPSPYMEPWAESTEAKKIESPDAMKYGTDTMGAAPTITLVQFAPKINYEASLQFPELPLPDPEGLSGPQPYGMAEQKLVKENVARKIAESLKKEVIPLEAQQEVYDALLLGKQIKDPKLARKAEKIREEVTESIREEAHLPSSWTILSTASKDWIPEEIEPYDDAKQHEINAAYDAAFKTVLESYASGLTPPLTAEQKEKIIAALTSGKVGSDIVEHFEAVSKIATKEIQQQFGLGSTWYKATDNPVDWKPVNFGIVTPGAVNQARGEFILENVEKFVAAIGDAMKNVFDKLPPDDPTQLVKDDYLTVISAALRELKALLRELQIKDSEKSKEMQIERASLSEDRNKALDEDIAKRKEIAQNQAKASFTSFMMKIFGPIIAALATVVGAVLSIFGGAGVPLIVAGIAVGVALTTYSVVDSITGCTGKLAQLVNDMFENSDALKGNESLKKFCKFLFMAAIVVVLVIVAVFSGGASVAAQTAGQVAKEAVMQAIKQLAIQAIIMAIMTSNSIPELIGAIAKDHGMNEKDSKFLEMAMMAVVMVITMVIGAATMAKAAGEGASTAAKDATKAAADAAAKAAADAAAAVAKKTATALELLKKGGGKIKDAVIDITVGIKKIGEGIVDFPKLFLAMAELRRLKNISLVGMAGEKALETLKQIEQFEKIVGHLARSSGTGLEKTLMITSKGIEVADGIVQGVMGMEVYRLLMKVGEIKMAEELLQALIDLLNKLMLSITTGLDTNMEALKNLNQFLSNFYESQSQLGTKIARTLQA